uniref:Uncharacterized protein n=1 Tax=Ditylum brightwellii TaxID=49249 RepID=A0A7S4VVD1_9STRA
MNAWLTFPTFPHIFFEIHGRRMVEFPILAFSVSVAMSIFRNTLSSDLRVAKKLSLGTFSSSLISINGSVSNVAGTTESLNPNKATHLTISPNVDDPFLLARWGIEMYILWPDALVKTTKSFRSMMASIPFSLISSESDVGASKV